MFDKLFPEALRNFEANKVSQEKNSKIHADAIVSSAMGSFIKEASTKFTPDIQSSIDFLEKDAFIVDEMLKLASLQLDDASPEGIEMFLKQYMFNELAFFPDKVNISVNLQPMETAQAGALSQGNFDVINATGAVNLDYSGITIQIPFIIRDKEILPFDTIQVGNESAVYTRENIRNILVNVKNRVETQSAVATPYATNVNNSLSAFVGVDSKLNDNPLADIGYMEEMLRIQSELGNSSQTGQALGVYSSIIEDLLEKTANIQKVHNNYAAMEKDLISKYKVNAEKLASEDYIEDEELRIRKDAILDEVYLDSIQLADIQILKNGAKFVYFEKDGNTLATVPARLFTLLVGANGQSNKRLVVTADGRYKLLKPGEKFMYSPAKDVPVFDIPETNIDGLNPGDSFTFNINGAHSVPMVVTKVISGAEHGLNVSKFVYCYDTEGNECVMIPLSNVSDNQLVYQSKQTVIKNVAQMEPGHKLTFYNMYLKSKVPTLCVAPDTVFIKLKTGEIGNMQYANELMLSYDDNVKLAYTQDCIHISKTAEKPEVKFSAVINWYDKKRGGNKSTTFNNIPKAKLMNILKIIGFEYAKISEVIYRASKGDVLEIPITRGMTPWVVRPELTAAEAASKSIKDIKDALFSTAVASKAIGMLGAGVLAGASPNMGKLEAFSSESEALAEKLEKIAEVKHNKEFTNMAGIMVIKNRIDNMLKDAINGAEFKGHEVLAELDKLDPVMEKIARDLVELKLAQAINRNEVISPNIINATLRHMDGLHKYSRIFK